MSDELSAESGHSGVSPQRKKISTAILALLIVVLVIELRAGYGHMKSGEALQAAAPEGGFEDMTRAQLEEMLILSPSCTEICQNGDETEFRYGWFSLLRPLLARQEAAYYVVILHRREKQLATRYSPEAPTDAEIANAKRAMELLNSPPSDGDEQEGDDNRGGGPRPGGPPGSGSRPAMTERGDEASERRRPAPESRQRPALEDEPAAEPKAAEPKAAEPKAPEPKASEPIESKPDDEKAEGSASDEKQE